MSGAKEYLESHGVRPSQQRIAVMEYLLTHRTHPTVEMIYDDLVKGMPTLSRTTIYNTLGLLARSGAILSLNINGAMANYDGDVTPHAHFLCSRCGRIFDIVLDDTSFMERNRPKNVIIDDVQLYYKGVCEECNKNNG